MLCNKKMKMSDWFVVLSQKQDSQTGFWRTPCDVDKNDPP